MKNNEIQAGITDLESKNTALEARLAALKTKPAPMPRVEELIVRVTEFVGPGEFVMPNSAELKRLRDIVCARYPQLAGEFTGKFAADDARAHEEGFELHSTGSATCTVCRWRTRRRAFKRLVGR